MTTKRIAYATTIGFGVIFQYADGRRRHYSPTVTSFGRYVDVLKSLAWTEKRLGLGMSLRMPPGLARRSAGEAARVDRDMSYLGSRARQTDLAEWEYARGGYCCIMAAMHMGHDGDCPNHEEAET